MVWNIFCQTQIIPNFGLAQVGNTESTCVSVCVGVCVNRCVYEYTYSENSAL